jgi:chromosome segregation ATPase
LEKQLHGIKGQPYQLLDRLQKTEDSMRAAWDEKDKVLEQVKVLEEQNRELQSHLEGAIVKGNDFKARLELLQVGEPDVPCVGSDGPPSGR